jgi:hypothetical protein
MAAGVSASQPLPRRGDAAHQVTLDSGVVVQWEDRGTRRRGPSWEGTDPDLEPGFPVSVLHTAGSYHGGPAIHTLVGNIDGDPELEILATGLAEGPLYAWNHDGTLVPGWPVSTPAGEAYPTLGQLAPDPTSVFRRFEVFAAYGGQPGLYAWFGNGVVLSGWPRVSANYIGTPATLANVNGGGTDEIFVEEEDFSLHGYSASGTVLPGWPVMQVNAGQERHTPAVADVDGDGDLEILSAGDSGTYLLGYHHDGTTVDGFPWTIVLGYTDTFPVVGDVDGDGALEVLTVRRSPTSPFPAQVEIRSTHGAIERVLTASHSVFYGTAPALADLDNDGFPEIVLQTNGALDVWKGDGTPFPGWPQVWSATQWLGDSAPVVGDVTGDGLPDILITSQFAGGSMNGEVRLYDRNGNLHPHFPKLIPIGSGAVPAIADIDLDGRNEMIVSGSFWNGVTGTYPKVWVYDLGGGTHGPVQWGQFMGGPRHQGRYGQPID